MSMPDTVVATSGSDRAPYFAVSLFKFSVMSLCTIGIYELYWFYKNWMIIKEREKIEILPFWRAFFGFFYCYQCFSKIKDHATSLGLRESIAAGPLAVGWIITTLLWKLPDPYWLISWLAFVFILPVQVLANRINDKEAPSHDPNAHFTARDIVVIVFGTIFSALAVVGSFLPDQ